MKRRRVDELKVKAYCDREQLRQQRHAMDAVSEMQKASDRAWEDRTVADSTNLKIWDAIQAERRARMAADSGPRVFGVVIMPQQLDDARAWEREAARLEERKAHAIPAKEVSGGPGERELPEKLGTDLRQEAGEAK